MALPTNGIRLMELRDVKIAKLLTDLSSAPTYGASVDLQGAVKLLVTPKTETKKLQGDSKLLDVYQRTTEVELDVEIALLGLDALQIIIGGSVTTDGVSPNQSVTYSLTGDDTVPPYFKLEGKWTYAGEGIGDAHVVLYKCKVTDAPSIELNDASGNFGTVNFKALALSATSNSKWLDIVLNETEQPIV